MYPACSVNLLAQAVHLAAQVAYVATQLVQYLVKYLALAFKRVTARRGTHRSQLRALGVLGNELVYRSAVNNALFAQHRHLLGDVLQLPHVARPLVFQHHGLGLFGKRNLRQAVLLGHLHGEQAEQQQYVLATVAQRGHLYGNGVQAVI